MNAISRTLGDIVVVDANLQDYDGLLAEPALCDIGVLLFPAGEVALRAVDAGASTLWIVNTRLPDMSGIGLLTLVRRRQRRANIFLVGDAYSPEDEVSARQAGATAYLCKPLSAAWLEGYYPRCRSSAIRASPAFFCDHRHS